MLCILILILAFVCKSQQHLAFPINYCTVAMACVHDSRHVCASTLDGCSRRNFLDQCDMFEYNCDYGTDYEMDICDDPSNKQKSPDSKDNKIPLMHRTDLNRYLYSLYKDRDDSNEINDPKAVLQSPDYIKDKLKGERACKANCARPQTWATTVRGETRDFFRILQNHPRKK